MSAGSRGNDSVGAEQIGDDKLLNYKDVAPTELVFVLRG